MAGFDQAGLRGSEAIRLMLNDDDSNSVFSAIEQFQHDNGILLPSLQPALPFLDLHDVQRTEFHSYVLNNLREKLLEQVRQMEEHKLRELLEQCFPFVYVAELRPVIMEVLKYVPKTPEEYLEQLANDPILYEACAIEVKRQIWVKYHPLFGDAVGPLLNQYIEEKYALLFTTDSLKSYDFFVAPSKTRRQHSVVQGLAKMIGKSLDLYNLVLQFLRTLFLRTKETLYCTLRAELLMAVHDLEIRDIKDVDPCHKFTWCLDACIREKIIEGKRTKELYGFLESAKKAEEQVLGDIAMILCDPFAVNTVAVSIIKLLLRLVNTEVLPKASNEVNFLIRLLNLGLGAWQMIDGQSFKELPVNVDLFHNFLPFLMSLMVDSMLHSLGDAKLTMDEEAQQAASTEEHVPSFVHMLSSNSVAFTLAWYYALQAIKLKDRFTLNRLLPWLIEACQERAVDETILHALVNNLVLCQEEFSQADFCEVVFDNFLLVMMQQGNVLRHTLRLLWYVYPKMDSHKVVQVLTATQPSSECHSEAIQDLHASLVDRLANSNPSTPMSSIEQPSSASSLSSSSQSPLEYIQPSSS